MDTPIKREDHQYSYELNVDNNNGSRILSNHDSSDMVFNNSVDLVDWLVKNWKTNNLQDHEDVDTMLQEIQLYLLINP
jgi:hypothetical protein